ncbi:GON-4-like protein, partial [Chiloscyllium plagiosum]|uniref:GON-4-like protein n=1 Tax=Chiloscyllium plagiosum TaxID=36176 RepID=UPI001CB7BB6A
GRGSTGLDTESCCWFFRAVSGSLGLSVRVQCVVVSDCHCTVAFQRSLPAIHQWLELRKVEARARVEEAAGGSEKDPELPEGEVGCSRCPPAAPLQIPDGVTLLVKPRLGHLTKRELRRCKRRPSATKPVLIHPAVKRTPCKQPGPLLPPQPGARPPPRLIQPAPSVPFPPQPQAVPTLAPARPCPSPRLCGGSSGRKPRGRRPGRGEGRGRRGGPRPAIVPVTVQQAPVILTVPAGVKLLSLPAAGSVLDVASGHTLRLATMIVSQPAFTCPLPRPPASGDGEPGSGACSTLRAEAGQREEPAVKVGCPGPQLVNGALGSVPDQPAVKTEPAEGTDPGNPQESAVPEQPLPQVPLAPDSPPRDQGAPGTSDKQQVLLRLGEELDVGSPLESVSRQPPVPEKAEPGAAEASPGEERCQELLETSRDGTEDTAPSPEDLKSLLDKVDKDGPEEEEEDDDFDDLTEDEEVLSSASEESALSVPELQVRGQGGRGRLSARLYACPPACTPVRPPACPPARPPARLSISPPAPRLSACPPAHLSAHPPTCPPARQSARPSLHLSTRPPSLRPPASPPASPPALQPVWPTCHICY